MVICCCICLEDIGLPSPTLISPFSKKNDERVAAVRCGHFFHYACLKKWWMTFTKLESSGGEAPCPVCRSMNPPELFQIHLASTTMNDTCLSRSEEDYQKTVIIKHDKRQVEEDVERLNEEFRMTDETLRVETKRIAELTVELDVLKKESLSWKNEKIIMKNLVRKKYLGEPNQRILRSRACKLKHI